MTKTRLIHLTAYAAALGGGAWLAKIAVLAVNDGADSAAVAVLYLTGAVLLAAGAATLTLRLARGRIMSAAAVLLGPVVFVLSYTLLDGIFKPLADDTGWFADEAGIVATGAFWLAVGALLARRAATPHARMR